jgi:hypothetical protein
MGGTSGVTVLCDPPEDAMVFSPEEIAYRILTNEEGPGAKIARPRYLGAAGCHVMVRGPSRFAIEARTVSALNPPRISLQLRGEYVSRKTRRANPACSHALSFMLNCRLRLVL